MRSAYSEEQVQFNYMNISEMYVSRKSICNSCAYNE